MDVKHRASGLRVGGRGGIAVCLRQSVNQAESQRQYRTGSLVMSTFCSLSGDVSSGGSLYRFGNENTDCVNNIIQTVLNA